VAQLDAWLQQALTVESVEALLSPLQPRASSSLLNGAGRTLTA
jgi:hypothetical protein